MTHKVLILLQNFLWLLLQILKVFAHSLNLHINIVKFIFFKMVYYLRQFRTLAFFIHFTDSRLNHCFAFLRLLLYSLIVFKIEWVNLSKSSVYFLYFSFYLIKLVSFLFFVNLVEVQIKNLHVLLKPTLHLKVCHCLLFICLTNTRNTREFSLNHIQVLSVLVITES